MERKKFEFVFNQFGCTTQIISSRDNHIPFPLQVNIY
jgi:hypothetical protein